MKALSNPQRLMLLCVLVDGEKTVSELNARVVIPQSTLSQHLAWLRREGMVEFRKEARSVYYSLQNKEMTEVIMLLHRLYCGG